MKIKHAVVLLSGGLDSLVTLADARSNRTFQAIHGLRVDYGQRQGPQEAFASRRMVSAYGVHYEEVTVGMSFLDGHRLLDPGITILGQIACKEFGVPYVESDKREHIVPYRNSLMLSLGSMFAASVGATDLWVGFDYNEERGNALDKSPAYVDAFNTTLSIAADTVAPVKVHSPLQGNHKRQTVRMGEGLGVDWSLSWSCYNGFDRHCGGCGACEVRKKGFREAGTKDPTEYLPRQELRSLLGVVA